MTSLQMKIIIVSEMVVILLLLIALIMQKIKNSKKKKELNEKVDSYKNMMTQKIELDSNTVNRLQDEIKKLKQENENFRISINNFVNKPGRRELLKFEAYQNAVENLCITNPGFAASWHTTVKEIEEKQKEIFIGKIPFIKKIFPKKDSTPILIEKN